mgnify:CR=1 FL=1
MKDPVFIVGSPRSGTTLLASLIDNHCDAICLIEPYLSWLQTGRFESNYLMESNVGLYGLFPPHRFIAYLCENSSFQAVGFKETFRTKNHPTFPSEDFIRKNRYIDGVDKTLVIIRDPRDIWLSVVRRHSKYENDRKTLGELLDAWNRLCLWIESDSLDYIKYEDLVQNPQSLYSILEVLDLDFSEEILDNSPKRGFGDQCAQEGKGIFQSSVGRYEDELKPEIENLITSRCNPILARFGYSS